MIKIEDLTVSKELDVSEMAAVRGGLIETKLNSDNNICVDIGASLQSALKEGGPVQMISTAAQIMGGQTYGLNPC